MKALLVIVGGLFALVAVGAGAFFLGTSGGDVGQAVDNAKAAVTGEPAPAGEAAAPAAQAAPAEQAAAGGGEEEKKDLPPPRRVDDVVRPEGWPVYAIELAAFRDLEIARQYQAVMAARNLEPELVETVDDAGRNWYRVRVGHYDDPRQAAARLPEVQRKAGILGIVTTEIPQDAAN